ncbi:MAG: hypothetical protein CMI96_03640 [Pelagibacteraceae bacterium]|nr:hypothetical protein [Pelagibacteraceae bacterium]|tara:strand:+ start:14568 stop:14990 length:423 start_codon:yes stop_codon:yes gene_type:complete
MFIECSECNYKYLVNSADLKPNGRLVKCANCGHQWFQNLEIDKLLTSASVTNNVLNDDKLEKNKNNIKNLPSTIVKEQKFSTINTFAALLFLILLITMVWLFKNYGLNIFVLIDFYFREFFFNINLIINDIASIIYNILN